MHEADNPYFLKKENEIIDKKNPPPPHTVTFYLHKINGNNSYPLGGEDLCTALFLSLFFFVQINCLPKNFENTVKPTIWIYLDELPTRWLGCFIYPHGFVIPVSLYLDGLSIRRRRSPLKTHSFFKHSFSFHLKNCQSKVPSNPRLFIAVFFFLCGAAWHRGKRVGPVIRRLRVRAQPQFML